jgi:hypothetical protein
MRYQSISSKTSGGNSMKDIRKRLDKSIKMIEKELKSSDDISLDNKILRTSKLIEAIYGKDN